MTTVEQALKRGKVTVNIPVLVITYGVMGLGFILWATGSAPSYFALSFILIGHFLGWIYWSFAITRWRIWAFSVVDDLHELKSRAITNKLIWPDGHIFEKTEIRTRKDKALLKSLETKFNELPKEGPVVDDPSIPPITKVFYSKLIGFTLITLAVSAGFSSYGAYVLITSDELYRGTFFLLVGIYLMVKTFRDKKNRRPQLILDDKGVKIKEGQYLWSEIMDFTITHSSNTWLTLNTSHGDVNTTIDGLEISGFELQDKMKIYQLRFTKATAATV